MSQTAPEAPPPCLARQLANDIKGIRAEMDGIQALAKSAGHLYPGSEVKMAEVMQRVIVIGSYVRGIETTINAHQHVGNMERAPRQTPCEDLELVALAAPMRGRMLQSLHRAGDHTLDGEEGHP